MASPHLPPNPCLIAIILVVKFYDEPQIVFHYPPRPGEDNSLYKNYLDGDLTDDDSTSSSDDESTRSSDERSKQAAEKVELSNNGNNSDADLDEAGSASPEKHDGAHLNRQARWNDLFGFPSAMLAKLLCPASSNHKRRFEMGIDGKVFLGWPVYKRNGRGWVRKRRPRISKSTDNRSEVKTSLRRGRETASKKTPGQVSDELGETSSPGIETEDEHSTPGEITRGLEPSSNETSTQSFGTCKDAKGGMHSPETKPADMLEMFNIIFVLDPPPLEYHLRVDEMYSHVVKKFSRALKWEQVRSNYVAKEASIISYLYRSGGKIEHCSPRERSDHLQAQVNH